jgi:hypothetical protein
MMLPFSFTLKSRQEMLQPVTTTKQKVRLALQGPSGSGKSYSALLLAFGLTGACEKIAIIDTDGAASLYSYFGPFNTLSIAPPFTPQKFTDALELCERSGIEAIIIDSLSAEWVDEGGVLDSMRECEHPYNVIDAHTDLMRALRNTPLHLIATIRSRDAYRLIVVGKGKEVQKIGLEPLQQDDIHYLFHTVLGLDMKHRATALKDRTSFFQEQGTVMITEEIAALYSRWCGEKTHQQPSSLVLGAINKCNTLHELLELLLQTEVEDIATLQAFVKRKQVLAQMADNLILSPFNLHTNGTDHNHRATA